MSLIDTTYFIKELQLNTDECPDLQGFIDRFEPEILQKVLGYDLYYAFTLAISGDYGDPDQKWIDLRDGSIYLVDLINTKWTGLVNTLKRSIIANYVFYKYTCHGMAYNSAFGIKQPVSENSPQIDKRALQMFVYNDMVDMITELDLFINQKNFEDSTTYPNYEPELIRKINLFNL